jgi:hypothetical protein
VVPSRIVDVVGRPDRDIRVNKLLVSRDKVCPFMVLGHGDGSGAEALDSTIRHIRFTLQDTSIGIVRLLNLARNDRLQLPAGRFEVEVGLVTLAGVMVHHYGGDLPGASNSPHQSVSPTVCPPPISAGTDPAFQ